MSDVSWNRITDNRKYNRIEAIQADPDLTDIEEYTTNFKSIYEF